MTDKELAAIAEGIQADALAAVRAERGEFIYTTRAEVRAFVASLPSGMKVQWATEPAVGSVRYRVTFWKSFWQALASPAANEVSEHD